MKASWAISSASARLRSRPKATWNIFSRYRVTISTKAAWSPELKRRTNSTSIRASWWDAAARAARSVAGRSDEAETGEEILATMSFAKTIRQRGRIEWGVVLLNSPVARADEAAHGAEHERSPTQQRAEHARARSGRTFQQEAERHGGELDERGEPLPLGGGP